MPQERIKAARAASDAPASRRARSFTEWVLLIGGGVTVAHALLWAERSPRFRFPLVTVSALFLASHALLHAYDTARGALGHHYWLLDLPGVYAPGLLLPFLAWSLRPKEEPQSKGDLPDGSH